MAFLGEAMVTLPLRDGNKTGKQEVFQALAIPCSKDWVAVKEFNVNYHNMDI